MLVVITAPGAIPGEVELLEGLLEAGLERLHLRKPGGSVEGLVPSRVEERLRQKVGNPKS